MGIFTRDLQKELLNVGTLAVLFRAVSSTCALPGCKLPKEFFVEHGASFPKPFNSFSKGSSSAKLRTRSPLEAGQHELGDNKAFG